MNTALVAFLGWCLRGGHRRCATGWHTFQVHHWICLPPWVAPPPSPFIASEDVLCLLCCALSLLPQVASLGRGSQNLCKSPLEGLEGNMHGPWDLLFLLVERELLTWKLSWFLPLLFLFSGMVESPCSPSPSLFSWSFFAL